MAKVSFTAIIKVGKGKEDFVKYRKVTHLANLENYLNRKFPDWRFINLYDSHTKEFVECIKKNPIGNIIKDEYNVIVKCADGKFRKWKTSNPEDFLGFLKETWEGWEYAKFYHASNRKLWRHYINSKSSRYGYKQP